MKEKDIKHLEWLYERMKFVHGENEYYDYMIRFREILKALRKSTNTRSSCDIIFDQANKNDINND